MKFTILVLCSFIAMNLAQRPSFAGTAPIGFPVIETTVAEGLGNRFGDDDTPATTIRLPIEAQGNADLVARLRKLPKDQQPFWLLNWAALEENRKNPQSYEQRPNSFINSNNRAG